MRKSTEERLALLEHRMALLEVGKNSGESTPANKVLSKLGLSCLLRHMNDTIMANPRFSDYDEYLEGIYKCKITQENRLEYANKVSDLSFSILDEAVAEFKKSKNRSGAKE